MLLNAATQLHPVSTRADSNMSSRSVSTGRGSPPYKSGTGRRTPPSSSHAGRGLYPRPALTNVAIQPSTVGTDDETRLLPVNTGGGVRTSPIATSPPSITVGRRMHLLCHYSGSRSMFLPDSTRRWVNIHLTQIEGSFSPLDDMATSILGIHKHVPNVMQLYKFENEKEQAERRMTDPMYFAGMDVITTDEGFKFGMGYSNATAATFAACSVSAYPPAPVEMFWFLISVLLMASSPPPIRQRGVDDDRQGPLLQQGDLHDGSRDVSPDGAVDGHRGSLSQWKDKDLHGTREGRRGEGERSHATM